MTGKPNIKNSIICLFMFFASLSCFALNNTLSSDKIKFIEAEKLFLRENYSAALEYYYHLYEQDSAFRQNSNILYRIGLCLLKTPDKTAESILFFEKAVQHISTDYNEGSFLERNAPPDAFFYLGEAYRREYKFGKAIDAYRSFENYLPVEEVMRIEETRNAIQWCINAEKLVNVSKKETIRVTQTGMPAISINNNFHFVISGNGKTVIYISDETGSHLTNFSTLNEFGWSKPQDISTQLGVSPTAIPVFLSTNGTLMLISVSSTSGRTDEKDLYISYLKEGKWSSSEKLPEGINSAYNEPFACMSPDEKYIYFASNRPGGEGGFDIYRSQRNGDHVWSFPENLGPVINTLLDENRPQVLPDNNTLLFSSCGHFSMGEMDLFFSQLIGQDEWSLPVNMGFPINTPGDDLFYFTGETTNRAFIPVHGKGQSKYWNIFQLYIMNESEIKHTSDASLPLSNIRDIRNTTPGLKNNSEKGKIVMHGIISDSDKITNGEIKIHVDGTTNKGQSIPVNIEQSSDAFSFASGTGNYIITIEKEGYKTIKVHVAIPVFSFTREMYFTVKLEPEELNRHYALIQSVHFREEEDTLTRESKIEMEKVCQIMKNEPDLLLEVEESKNDPDIDPVQKKISEKRIRNIINYLTGRGVNGERFISVGIENIIRENDLNHHPVSLSLQDNNRQYINLKIINTVPDKPFHLKNRTYRELQHTKNFYSVLLCKQDHKSELITTLPFKEYVTSKGLIYTSGEFSRKSDAVELLNKAIDEGFTGARILDRDAFEMIQKFFYHHLRSEIEKETVDPEKQLYTIQVKALINPVDISYFRNLKGVKKRNCKDGLYRYTYQKVKGYEKAVALRDQLAEKGYPDAFIISIDRFKKITGKRGDEITENTLYTIQIKAFKDTVSEDYFKPLAPVKQTQGRDGVFRHTYGCFDKIQHARKELEKIIEMGYSDAFIIQINHLNNR